MQTRWIFICLLGLACSQTSRSGLLSAEPTSDSAAAPQEETFTQPNFTVPPGFTIELAAGPPLVKHPMMATFDERGRLFIAESAGLNLRNHDLEEQLPNFIRLLEDTDGDGRFDKSTIFADKMTFPMGGTWHDGSLYVASPPNIWRLTDTDDDGVADERTILVSRFGYNGNAADIHGCFPGPEGRLYWCDGRHGHEFHDADGNVTSQGKAARIFSCRPDGSDVQVHCGGGMDNPVEIDFLPGGDMLGTVNLFYRQRGDCLVHWMHGGVYPREDQFDCLAEFRRTGDLLPPIFDFGHVAVSGTTRYPGTAFGPEFANNFFVTEFNTHGLQRVTLSPEGSTYAAVSEPFLQADSDDFHPTDVLPDADGSLLVIDTGGWFRIGCPTSQIAKPNILGAIYRIRKTGAKRVSDPRGLKLTWDNVPSKELVQRLSDARFAMRERAIDCLTAQGEAAVADLEFKQLQSAPAEVQLGAIWALARMNVMGIKVPAAQSGVREYLNASVTEVRQAAAFSAGQTGDVVAVPRLMEIVSKEEPAALRRTAATALGKLKHRVAVSTLLRALSQEHDRMLEHALIYALIEIDSPAETLAGLKHASPQVRRGALIALDQMPDVDLQREAVLPLLNTEDRELIAATLEVIGRHPTWAKETIATLRKDLASEQGPEDLSLIRSLLLAFSKEESAQELIGDLLSAPSSSAERADIVLEVMSQTEVRPWPESWQQGILRWLEVGNVDRRIKVIETLAAADVPVSTVELSRCADDKQLPRPARDTALILLGRHGGTLENDQLQQLLDLLQSDQAVTRLSASEALGGAALTYPQAKRLLPALQTAGPLELPGIVQAFRLRTGENPQDNPSSERSIAFGQQWLTALANAPSRGSLSARQLQELLEPYPAEVREAGTALLKSLHPGNEQQAARLAELLPKLSGGDAAKGKQVFYSRRATCSACHRIEKEGGQVGPELTGIGRRRNLRDLTEAVVFPSASLARDFESYAIETSSGQIHTGLILKQTPDALVLRTTQQKEIILVRDEIEELLPSKVSIMPQGLDRVLSEQELRDLLAYLESLKE